MLRILLFVLVVLWLAGMVTSYTAGGLLHLLLLAAVIILLVNLFTRRRAVS